MDARDMIGSRLAPLRGRWDYEADPEAQVPFARIVTLINLRRVEIFSLALLVDEIVEIYLNLADRMMLDGWLALGCIPVLLAFLIIGNRLQRSQNHRLQSLFPSIVIAFTLVSTQVAIAILASDGRLTGAYQVTILAIAIFFVFPPHRLALIFSLSLLAYILIILRMPVSQWEKLVAGLNAAMATGAAIAAGWLIYAARAQDHVQRLLINRQNTQLLARGREMDELMAITAHDLRSPLLGLRNLFQLATMRAPVDPALPLQVIGDGMRSLDAMLDLVRRLLAVHQAEHDPGQPAVRDDLRVHLTAAIDRAGTLASAGHVTIKADLAPRPVRAVFDPAALAQMLDNLLANAVRFSSEGETVFAQCRYVSDFSTIIIEDHGPGIAAEDRPFLFEKFKRGQNAARQGQEGTGIGLFIVATLAERIGATVRYGAASPQGSKFEIWLPAGE